MLIINHPAYDAQYTMQRLSLFKNMPFLQDTATDIYKEDGFPFDKLSDNLLLVISIQPHSLNENKSSHVESAEGGRVDDAYLMEPEGGYCQR